MSRTPDKPREVTLVSPDGDETVVTSPSAVNNLLFGAGYKPKTGTAADAIASVSPEPAKPADPPKK